MSEQQPPHGDPPPPPQETTPSPSGEVGLDVGRYLSRAWEITLQNFALVVLGYVLVVVIIALSAIVVVGPFILAGPLMLGYLRAIQKRLHGEPATIGTIVDGFQDFGKGIVTFLLLCGLGLVLSLVQILLQFIPVLGQLLSVIAALVFASLISFVFQIAALSSASPTDAISRSIKFGMARFWPVLGLTVLLILVNTAGVLLCCVGMLFTTPLVMVAWVVAYEEYFLPQEHLAR